MFVDGGYQPVGVRTRRIAVAMEKRWRNSISRLIDEVCSPEAGYVTRQVIALDGGFEA